MTFKSLTIAVFASCSLLACGGGGDVKPPPPPVPVPVVSGLFSLAGSFDLSGSRDGSAFEARFSFMPALKSDTAGNIYIADANAIRKLTPAGVVSTLAGAAGQAGSADGVGAAARFSSPGGIAIDTAGNVYVSDTSNHTIRKITPAGLVTTPYGSAGRAGSADGSGNDARFNLPQHITIDTLGNLYVADFRNFTIRKITPNGLVSTIAGRAGVYGSVDGGAATACLYFPFGIDVDATGNLYVSDSGNRTIRKIAASGEVSTLAGDPRPELVGGCTTDVDRRRDGYSLTATDGIGRDANFVNVISVAVDPNGNIFVSDIVTSSIRKITQAGVVSTVAGVNGRSGVLFGSLPGLLTAPYGLTAIGPGVLVAVSGNSLVKIVLP